MHTTETRPLSAELQKLPQWVPWRLERNADGRLEKVLYDPNQNTLTRANIKDKTTWSTYDRAFLMLDLLELDGVEFIFTADDDFARSDWCSNGDDSLAALLAQPPEPLPMLVAELLPAQSVCVLYGEIGIGKSFLALDMALSVASGTPFLGLPVSQPARVGYITPELPKAEVYKRVQALCKYRFANDPDGQPFQHVPLSC